MQEQKKKQIEWVQFSSKFTAYHKKREGRQIDRQTETDKDRDGEMGGGQGPSKWKSSKRV